MLLIIYCYCCYYNYYCYHSPCPEHLPKLRSLQIQLSEALVVITEQVVVVDDDYDDDDVVVVTIIFYDNKYSCNYDCCYILISIITVFILL